jgi:hypothetical protein
MKPPQLNLPDYISKIAERQSRWLGETKNNLENKFDAPVLMLKNPARTT